MRRFLAVIAVLGIFSPLALASKGTCFVPKITVSEGVPSEICLKNITFDFKNNKAIVTGSDILKELNFESEVPRRDDYSVLNLSADIREYEGTTCGDRQVVTVKLSALFEPMGNGINESIKIAVENSTTNDWCHSEPDLEIIEYTRVK